MTTDFGSLVAEFRPAETAPAPKAWEGPVPQVIAEFVANLFTTGKPQERKLTVAAQADELHAVCKQAAYDHNPRLSIRFVRTYAQLVKDGQPQTEEKDGKTIPVEDTTKLLSVRISASKYSPRGGGARAAKNAAAPAVEAPAVEAPAFPATPTTPEKPKTTKKL